ncbi:DMT family transporter [Sulfitobacter donghicola]|uniref:Membrane protein n=1 Tax=Sulfitobacter donghicola DSW-25 = KCTC 12864 = JCM 14565 TaxID=1300350 RepID=A0A073IJ39_9RHOB|nr:DMT family transporter [Sulfitobacter donghicola]KEJ89575.1 membrane protein [Sulfitobacter donghicola DSW-25 = KCTC 12864 = JCM 14565]KIN69407.1 Integral membrane protein [Sulfitobacter donghicola DSW-25 = KCTC 12864 = JCM 14565]
MDNLRGAIFMVVAMLGFAIEDSFIKLMGGALPIGQIILLLGIGGSAVFGTIVLSQGRALFERDMLSGPVVMRGVGEIVGTMCFISAIVFTPLSTASAILQATPLVVTLAAALFLGETVGWRRWSAIFAGFFGVLMIIRPGLEGFSPLSLFALGGVFGLAARDVATRKVTPALSTMQLSFLGFLVLIPAGLLMLMITGKTFEPMNGFLITLMIAAVVMGIFAYYAIVAAMRIGEVSFVSPFRYSRLIFALIIGIAFFNERPDLYTLLGSAIIVASGIYTVLRERKQRRKVTTKPSNA